MILLLRLVVAAIVLLQRFALPVAGGQVALIVPVVLMLVAVGFCTGLFAVDRRRLPVVTVLVGSTVLITLLQLVSGIVPSLLSVALLCVLYLPVIVRPRQDPAVGRKVVRFFIGLMVVAALLSIAQFVVQYAGLTWVNWVSRLVPANLLLQEFNDGNPISYGSDIDRATALVFLEPSFLSLFLGIAVVLAMRERMRWPVVTLLLLGIVPTVAGNGLVVVGAAVLVMAFTRLRRRLLALVPALVLAASAALLTPLGALYLGRATEGGGTNSSSGLRFVQPYLALVPPPLQHLESALIGFGAGSTRDYIADHFSPTTPLLATVLPKIVYEFGLLGVAGILLPLAVLLLGPLRRRPELVGLAAAFFVVNGSLLTPLMVFTAVLVLLWLPDLDDGDRTTRLARRGTLTVPEESPPERVLDGRVLSPAGRG